MDEVLNIVVSISSPALSGQPPSGQQEAGEGKEPDRSEEVRDRVFLDESRFGF